MSRKTLSGSPNSSLAGSGQIFARDRESFQGSGSAHLGPRTLVAASASTRSRCTTSRLWPASREALRSGSGILEHVPSPSAAMMASRHFRSSPVRNAEKSGRPPAPEYAGTDVLSRDDHPPRNDPAALRERPSHRQLAQLVTHFGVYRSKRPNDHLSSGVRNSEMIQECRSRIAARPGPRPRPWD